MSTKQIIHNTKKQNTMQHTTTTKAAIFVTDYESYNNGTQFKLGHWITLSDYSSASELMEYIDNHFKINGIDDYELMVTDFEGFDATLYSESMGIDDFEKIYKYLEFDFGNMDDSELMNLWNEYCDDVNYMDDLIYSFDDDFFTTFFHSKPMEAARAASFGNLNWSDDYIYFDGYGNLQSTDNVRSVIDEKALIEWALNK